MEFSLFNLTNEPLFVKHESPKHVEVVRPNDFATLPASRSSFILSSVGEGSGSEVTLLDRASASLEVASQYMKQKLSRRSRWSNISTPEDCPWRIYRDQASRKRMDILVLPKRALQAFLSDLPDTTPLYSLCLPGRSASWPLLQGI